ncbi:MAG: tyrosine-type recombinase/integrase [Peptostreptococcales bacterium]
MAKKNIRINNKTDKPDNIVLRESEIAVECSIIQKDMPNFFLDFFVYLKNNVLPSTRIAYLKDIKFFCNYLIEYTDIEAETIKDITVEDFNKIQARDINYFIGEYCTHYTLEKDNNIYVFENRNPSLARKKSSLSVLFKYLYRDNILEKNITDGFNPIKLPKTGSKEIKRLEVDEVKRMLDAVSTGSGLTEKEIEYWKKTKYRDKAIIVLFVTYGLRLYELHQLNVSSFNFSRGEFKIYRKRGKESIMPLNKSVELVIHEYLENERPKTIEIDPKDSDALFLSLQKKRMTERAIRTLVKKYTSIGMQTARDQGYSPHKLRATCATSLIEQGNSIYDVQNLLDHENIITTQLYAAHKKNAKRELINKFEWLDEFE